MSEEAFELHGIRVPAEFGRHWRYILELTRPWEWLSAFTLNMLVIRSCKPGVSFMPGGGGAWLQKESQV